MPAAGERQMLARSEMRGARRGGLDAGRAGQPRGAASSGKLPASALAAPCRGCPRSAARMARATSAWSAVSCAACRCASPASVSCCACATASRSTVSPMSLWMGPAAARRSVVSSMPWARTTPCPSVRSSKPSPRLSLRPAPCSTRVKAEAQPRSLVVALRSWVWISPSVSSWTKALARSPCNSLLTKPDSACCAGSGHCGILRRFGTRPVTMGQSGSPFRCSTTTSWPMRGTCTAPKRFPCHADDTRTQHELLALRWPIRSQCIWIRMRP